MMGISRVSNILMERDRITLAEANVKIKHTHEMIANVEYDYGKTEDIMRKELGLEMDYIMDIL